MSIIARNAPDDARRGRHTLSLKTWQPRNSAQLPSEPIKDSPEPSATQLWEAGLWEDRNAWDVNRRRGVGGLFALRERLQRHDAERLWAAAFEKEAS